MLGRLTPPSSSDLLVGAGTGDDAAVWRLSDERALVVTVDVITPVVDDARTWGRITAANSVSDVYAMGATPLLALDIVTWPRDELSLELLGDVLLGVEDIASSDGFVLAGGHSIDDPVPKVGLAVVGEARPDRLLTNAGLRAGQSIVLTKPLGVGVITTAIKRGVCPDEVAAAAIASMERTNAAAARIALDLGATGATDVTGFGLFGHLGRMALESRVGAHLEAAAVPVLAGAHDLAAADVVPGGSQRNLAWMAERITVAPSVDPLLVLLLADAQTSGGLCFGVDPPRAAEAVDRLLAAGHHAAVIGEVARGDQPGTITIR